MDRVPAANHGGIAMGSVRHGYHLIHSADPISVKLLHACRAAIATGDV